MRVRLPHLFLHSTQFLSSLFRWSSPKPPTVATPFVTYFASSATRRPQGDFCFPVDPILPPLRARSRRFRFGALCSARDAQLRYYHVGSPEKDLSGSCSRVACAQDVKFSQGGLRGGWSSVGVFWFDRAPISAGAKRACLSASVILAVAPFSMMDSVGSHPLGAQFRGCRAVGPRAHGRLYGSARLEDLRWYLYS